MGYLDYYCELLKNKFLATGKITEEEISGNKTKQLNKNLFHKMSDKTKNEYLNGDGEELNDGRIKSIRSSAAMIYNLLGNEDVVLSKNLFLQEGKYVKEFELQLATLKRSPRKANLDAWLFNNECEIFIESKCLEWVENRYEKELKDSYFNSRTYFYPDTAEIFVDAAKQIGLSQYDSCQMFKHTLAIYNYLRYHSIKGKKVFLVNVVWEPDPNEVDEKIRDLYKLQLELEHKEFKWFYEKMHDIIKMISDSGNEFDILYLSVKDFYSMLVYSDEKQKEFVQRYL